MSLPQLLTILVLVGGARATQHCADSPADLANAEMSECAALYEANAADVAQDTTCKPLGTSGYTCPQLTCTGEAWFETGTQTSAVDVTCTAIPVSEKTCKELKEEHPKTTWKKVNDNIADGAICGSSEYTKKTTNDKACFPNSDQATAETLCKELGARLCTLDELESEATSGGGCSHDDSGTLMWSSTACWRDDGEPYFWASRENFASSTKCEVRNAGGVDSYTRHVRCCADQYTRPSPCETDDIPTDLPEGVLNWDNCGDSTLPGEVCEPTPDAGYKCTPMLCPAEGTDWGDASTCLAPCPKETTIPSGATDFNDCGESTAAGDICAPTPKAGYKCTPITCKAEGTDWGDPSTCLAPCDIKDDDVAFFADCATDVEGKLNRGATCTPVKANHKCDSIECSSEGDDDGNELAATCTEITGCDAAPPIDLDGVVMTDCTTKYGTKAAADETYAKIGDVCFPFIVTTSTTNPFKEGTSGYACEALRCSENGEWTGGECTKIKLSDKTCIRLQNDYPETKWNTKMGVYYCASSSKTKTDPTPVCALDDGEECFAEVIHNTDDEQNCGDDNTKECTDDPGWSKCQYGDCNCPGNAALAFRQCDVQGARLCTMEELISGRMKNVGCADDKDTVWTSTPCRQGNGEMGYYAIPGDARELQGLSAEQLAEKCLSPTTGDQEDDDAIDTRCCADQYCTVDAVQPPAGASDLDDCKEGTLPGGVCEPTPEAGHECSSMTCKENGAAFEAVSTCYGPCEFPATDGVSYDGCDLTANRLNRGATCTPTHDTKICQAITCPSGGGEIEDVICGAPCEVTENTVDPVGGSMANCVSVNPGESCAPTPNEGYDCPKVECPAAGTTFEIALNCWPPCDIPEDDKPAYEHCESVVNNKFGRGKTCKPWVNADGEYPNINQDGDYEIGKELLNCDTVKCPSGNGWALPAITCTACNVQDSETPDGAVDACGDVDWLLPGASCAPQAKDGYMCTEMSCSTDKEITKSICKLDATCPRIGDTFPTIETDCGVDPDSIGPPITFGPKPYKCELECIDDIWKKTPLIVFTAAFDTEDVDVQDGCKLDGNRLGVTYMTCSSADGKPPDDWAPEPCKRNPNPSNCPLTAVDATTTAAPTTLAKTTITTAAPANLNWDGDATITIQWDLTMAGHLDGIVAEYNAAPGDIIEWRDLLDDDMAIPHPVVPATNENIEQMGILYWEQEGHPPNFAGFDHDRGLETWTEPEQDPDGPNRYRWIVPDQPEFTQEVQGTRTYAFYCGTQGHEKTMQGYLAVTNWGRRQRRQEDEKEPTTGCDATYVGICQQLIPKSPGVHALYFNDLSCEFDETDFSVTIDANDETWTLDPSETMKKLKALFGADADFTVECSTQKKILVQTRLKDQTKLTLPTDDTVYVRMSNGFTKLGDGRRARRADTVEPNWNDAAQTAEFAKAKTPPSPPKSTSSSGGGGGGSSSNNGGAIAGVVVAGLAVVIIVGAFLINYNSAESKARRATASNLKSKPYLSRINRYGA